MGTLTDLLKQKPQEKVVKTLVTESEDNIYEPVQVQALESMEEFEISVEDLEAVRAAVLEIDNMDQLTREEIIIGKYGSIKNPQTGKRFNIPGISYEDNYILNYANFMKMLVHRPDTFEKVMRWE